MIKTNPFTSKTFTAIWSKHFNQSRPGRTFDIIKGLFFVKTHFPFLFVNVGKTHTKGISYLVDDTNSEDLKGKVLLIYDVPSFSIGISEFYDTTIKRHIIKQYPGFLIDLTPYSDLNDFMAATFKKSSRYKLKKYKKKLETCFDISSKMFYGHMSKNEYDFVFKRFKELLVKRFADKKVTNNNLEKQEWDFYQEMAYPMILEKKAGLFVIYDHDQPIAVTLNYFSEDVLFDAITVFDIDYSKFHLGSINIMKLLEWCLQHDVKIFDFSKGYFDYKKRWANKAYDFHYHVIYDSTSLNARILATVLRNFFMLKQYLRDKRINEKLHRFTFRVKTLFGQKEPPLKYEFAELKEGFSAKKFHKMDLDASENLFLKKAIFDFLYLNNEPYYQLELFGEKESDSTSFVLSGKEKKIQLKIL